MPGIIREKAPALQGCVGEMGAVGSNDPGVYPQSVESATVCVGMTTAGRMAEPPVPAAGEKDSFTITG